MKSDMEYDGDDLHSAYSTLGIQPGDMLYVTGNLGNLGFHKERDKSTALESHHHAIRSAIGNDGTMVVPTHSFSLCNTSRPFHVKTTPSETGPLTEYVRQQPDSVRQFHPFSSVTAQGGKAADICGECTRHVYGPNTPFSRMIESNAWCVSIGLPPHRTSTIVHHMELVMGVPYRYTKEFMHPVWRDGQLRTEPFYLFVIYRQAQVERDKNLKIFQHPLLRECVREARVGMSSIWAYRMTDFATAVSECMTRDIYTWTRQPPSVRPYQI